MQLSATARVLVILNPQARRNSERLIADLRQASPDGWSWDFVETHREQFQHGQLSEAARVSEIAIAVGGDGTVTDAMTALGDTHIPLVILPGGSTNVIAQELRVPQSPADLA